MYLQMLQHISQNSQPLLTSSRAVFVPKRFYLELTIDPISLDRPPSKVGSQSLTKCFTLQVSYKCHTKYYEFKIKQLLNIYKLLEASAKVAKSLSTWERLWSLANSISLSLSFFWALRCSSCLCIARFSLRIFLEIIKKI